MHTLCKWFLKNRCFVHVLGRIVIDKAKQTALAETAPEK
jgi:hypothetical protein